MATALINQVAILEGMLGGAEDLSGLDEHTIQAALQRTRRIIEDINRGGSQTRNLLGLQRWNNLVEMIQNVAFIETDNGGQTDIVSWCERQWAETLQVHPHNVGTLKGLGRCWLLKAQAPLSRIYSSERSPSSSDDSGRYRLGVSRPRSDPTESEDIARISSANYVEARSLLRPALESLDRAIENAQLQGVMTGRLLEIVCHGA